MKPILFGPSGNSEAFYEAGLKHTYQEGAWLHDLGLNAFEYSFGRGTALKEDTGRKIAQEMAAHDIAVSVHAPYFINLAVADEERREKNIRYFLETAKGARLLGAQRVVFHPGAVTRMTRREAAGLAQPFLKEILDILDENGYGGLTFCPETMGKINQFGDLQEVIELCNLDERLIPTIDFGHLHSRGLGCIRSQEDYASILDALENGIGRERANVIHVHFSRMEYTKMGEKRHHTFADIQFGPEPDPLMELFAKRRMRPTVLSESAGTQALDALAMKQAYQAALSRLEV